MTEKKDDYIGSTEALRKAREAGISITLPTLYAYCSQHGMGRQLGGAGTKWVINKLKWEKFLNGTKNKK
jgi:hypothetical protein